VKWARLSEFVLVIVSLFVGAFFFILADRYYFNTHAGQFWTGPCLIRDEVLHHALEPNCSRMQYWGRAAYEIATNSLGLVDARIRDVTSKQQRPRLLLLGDSFTVGLGFPWQQTFAGLLQEALPQYEILNGAVSSYSPSNYLNVARRLLNRGIEFSEAIVFIDVSDIQDEAAFYRDKDATGAVLGPALEVKSNNLYTWLRGKIRNLPYTSLLFEWGERQVVRFGIYSIPVGDDGDVFDTPRSAWTYRPVDESIPFRLGYSPLGVEAGIERAKNKMNSLREELSARGIGLGVIIYPWPAQLAHNDRHSRHQQIWKQWCTGRCTRFISMFPDFFDVKDKCSILLPGCWYASLFIQGDVHFSEEGHKLVAAKVAESLTKSGPGFGAR